MWGVCFAILILFPSCISKSPKQSRLEAAHVEHGKGCWNKSWSHSQERTKNKMSWTLKSHDTMLWTGWLSPCSCVLPLHGKQRQPLDLFHKIPQGLPNCLKVRLTGVGGQSNMLAGSVSSTLELPVLCCYFILGTKQ